MSYLTSLCLAKPPVAIAGYVIIDRISYLPRNNQKYLCQGPGVI